MIATPQLKGFRFPCPYPEDDIKQFADYLKASRDQICDPWPEIVDLRFRRYAFTQPLIRIESRPTTQPQVSRSLKQYISDDHEGIHKYLDFTPAKNYGRICLGQIFEEIEQFGQEEFGSDDGIYYGLRCSVHDGNTALKEVVSKIVLVEELIATTCSFYIAKMTLTKQRVQLKTLEADWIDEQVLVLDGFSKGLGRKFQELYDVFAKAASLLYSYRKEGKFTGLPLLGMFLEPISFGGELPDVEVIDSQDRCDQLADALKKINTAKELIIWLDKSIHSSQEDRTLKRLIRKAFDWMAESDRLVDLYSLSTTQPVDYLNRLGFEQFITFLQKQYLKVPHLTKDRRRQTVLSPYYTGDRWHIKPYVDRPLDLTYAMLLALEALRQQINMSEGFCCPFMCMFPRESCWCETKYPDFKTRLVYLVRLAQDNAFGAGKWTDLPNPCGPTDSLVIKPLSSYISQLRKPGKWKPGDRHRRRMLARDRHG